MKKQIILIIIFTFLTVMKTYAKEKEAILIAPFGTSTKARVVYNFFEDILKKEFPETDIFWAYTSEKIREKINKIYTSENSDNRLLSPEEMVDKLKKDNYTKIYVQPLHIFTGYEYDELKHNLKDIGGITIKLSTPLLFMWEDIEEVVTVLTPYFKDNCLNIIVAHGSPFVESTSNTAYLWLDKIINNASDNLVFTTIGGVPTIKSVVNKIRASHYKHINFIPFMFVSGEHAMNDIMGDNKNSLESLVKSMGKSSEILNIIYNGEKQFISLGFIKGIDDMFLRNLKKTMANE